MKTTNTEDNIKICIQEAVLPKLLASKPEGYSLTRHTNWLLMRALKKRGIL